jgi:hypothetical protein
MAMRKVKQVTASNIRRKLKSRNHTRVDKEKKNMARKDRNEEVDDAGEVDYMAMRKVKQVTASNIRRKLKSRNHTRVDFVLDCGHVVCQYIPDDRLRFLNEPGTEKECFVCQL